MEKFKWLFVAATVLVGAGGCDEGRDDSELREVFDNTEIDEAVTFRNVFDNGLELNGVNLNGVNFNGVNLNGVNLNGVNLNGVNLNGVNLNTNAFGGSLYITPAYAAGRVKAFRGQLEIDDNSGVTIRGNSLAGLEIEMNVNGTLQRLRIESVVADANDPDIKYTKLSVRNSGGTWETWCKDGYGIPTEAIVIEGAYDSNGNFLADTGAMAFACRGTASAKCIVWGYKPWDEVGGVSLRDHYQACLAMVRGDYCRTNTPHTANGTAIDVSDHGLSTQIQASGTNWPVEAQWGVDGAKCFSTPRKLIYPRTSINPCYGTVPSCPADKNTWVPGALLMTQANPT